MKGRIIIELDGKDVNIAGDIRIRNIIEGYEIVRDLAVCIGVRSPEDWARLSLYALSKIDSGDLDVTEVVVPTKVEE